MIEAWDGGSAPTCDETGAWLSQAAAGVHLETDTWQQIDKHLAECPRCAAALRDIAETLLEMSALNELETAFEAEEASQVLTAQASSLASVAADAGRRSWWRILDESLRQLADEFTVTIRGGQAAFEALGVGGLPLRLIPAPSAASYREQGAEIARGSHMVLDLPDPKVNFVVQIGLGPAQAQRGAILLGLFTAPTPAEAATGQSGNPVRGAQARLFDTNLRPLEWKTTNDDGLAAFDDLQPGDYVAMLRYAGLEWRFTFHVVAA